MEKNKDTESIYRCDALREILKEVHSLFTMFHESLRALLDKQLSGELARSHLYSFVLDYLTGKIAPYLNLQVESHLLVSHFHADLQFVQ